MKGQNQTSYWFNRAPLVAQIVKNQPAIQKTRVQSRVGKIPWRRKWQPAPVFLPGEFHGQRSLAGYSPWGHKKLEMTEQLTLWTPVCSKCLWRSVLYIFLFVCLFCFLHTSKYIYFYFSIFKLSVCLFCHVLFTDHSISDLLYFNVLYFSY